MNVLVVNAGSSSLKYQLIDCRSGEMKAKGLCERIGIDGKIEHKMPGRETYAVEIKMNSHTEAVKFLLNILTDKDHGCIESMNEISAVGHRVVHGGPYFASSVLATEEVIAKVELCRDLAPLHTDPALMGIRGCMEAMPEIPQVLVFDTAFHQTMPEEAYTYPISHDMAEKYHIRRYGFHGTSHRYVSGEMIKLLDMPAEKTKIVTCHLGNGSSIAAVKGGKVLDTTMGFTPLDGIPMGTRSGAIDPAIVTFLQEKEGWSADEVNRYLNKECGLLGMSGVSSDFRDITAAVKAGDENAIRASKTLMYQIRKYIGAYAAAMGGLDAVVFTAGLGENQANVREGAMEGLEFLGIDFDSDVNNNVPKPSPVTCLTKPNSKVKVYLIPTNEELMIALDTASVVSGK